MKFKNDPVDLGGSCSEFLCPYHSLGQRRFRNYFPFLLHFCSIFAVNSTEFLRLIFKISTTRINTRPGVKHTGDSRLTANLRRCWPYTVKFEVRHLINAA